MARAGVWDKAGADLGEAVKRASAIPGFDLNRQELAALRGVFERGFRSRFGSLQEARTFFKAVRQANQKIAAKLLGNLLLPVTNRAKLMLLRPDKLREARELGCLAGGFLSLPTLRAYFAARRSEHRMFGVQPLLVHHGAQDGPAWDDSEDTPPAPPVPETAQASS